MPSKGLVLLALCATAWFTCVVAQTEMSCGIIIWGNQDYEWNVTNTTVNAKGQTIKNYTSNCMRAVRNARQRCGGKALNFVVTHFWKYTNASGDPGRFCYKTNVGDDQVAVQCTDLVDWYPENVTTAQELLWRFYKGMKGCFITAIWEGFTKIKVTPHLDDGLGAGGWRNTLRLHPTQKLFGYSYADIMLWPLARALNESIVDTGTENTTRVYFTLQGEMNLALAAFPEAWKKVGDDARWVMSAGDPERAKNVKVGVSLNFNKLCGDYCYGGGGYTTTATVTWDVLSQINMPAYKDLLYSMDYLGVSNYPRVAQGNMNMESSANELNTEMQQAFQSNLMDFINYGKEFHLSEFGIGGGKAQTGNQPAENVDEAGRFTFFGLFGQYGHFPDPWQNPELRAFRMEFYKKALQWLSTGGGPQYQVMGAFMWSMSSWDVSGLYWASTTAEGSYYDPEVMNMIKAYNDNGTVPY